MSLILWLGSISEDYIIQWANKGLLRRGKKQLGKENITDWQLDDSSAQANIDGYQQILNGSGFDSAQCSCPADTTCFHLCCFLLGLKQRLDITQGSPQDIETLAAPWLISDEKQRQRLLGKTNMQRALRWIHQGIIAELSEEQHNLTAVIDEKERYQLIIPRMEGLPGSLCQCKKERCVHRALVVLQAGQQAGVLDYDSLNNELDTAQYEVLQQLKNWLHNLALQGMSGVSRLQIDYGQALVVELQQADLATPAKLQASLVSLLEQEWQRQLLSSPTRLRYVMAKLYAHIKALSCQPVPQPLLQLTGEHRRMYHVTHHLSLIGITVEYWQTGTDYHGYSVHFYAPEEQRYYSYSEVRSREYNEDWLPVDAFRQALLGEEKLSKLVQSRFILDKGWCSQDGRLSARQGSQVSAVSPCQSTDWSACCCDLSSLSESIAERILKNPYTADYSSWVVINTLSLSELSFDRYTQRWSAEAQDKQGQYFKVILSTTGDNASIVQRWRLLKDHTQAVFGRCSVDKNQLSLTPIALYCDACFKSLS